MLILEEAIQIKDVVVGALDAICNLALQSTSVDKLHLVIYNVPLAFEFLISAPLIP